MPVSQGRLTECHTPRHSYGVTPIERLTMTNEAHPNTCTPISMEDVEELIRLARLTRRLVLNFLAKRSMSVAQLAENLTHDDSVLLDRYLSNLPQGHGVGEFYVEPIIAGLLQEHEVRMVIITRGNVSETYFELAR